MGRGSGGWTLGREQQLVTVIGESCRVVAVSCWEDAMSVYTAAERQAAARTGDGPTVKRDLHESVSLVSGLCQLLFDAKFSVPLPRPGAVSHGK